MFELYREENRDLELHLAFKQAADTEVSLSSF